MQWLVQILLQAEHTVSVVDASKVRDVPSEPDASDLIKLHDLIGKLEQKSGNGTTIITCLWVARTMFFSAVKHTIEVMAELFVKWKAQFLRWVMCSDWVSGSGFDVVATPSNLGRIDWSHKLPPHKGKGCYIIHESELSSQKKTASKKFKKPNLGLDFGLLVRTLIFFQGWSNFPVVWVLLLVFPRCITVEWKWNRMQQKLFKLELLKSNMWYILFSYRLSILSSTEHWRNM